MLLAEELPLSPAESRLLEAAREFSRREVGPNAARWERERAYPRETIRAAAGLGLTRIQIPVELGGLDLRFRAKVRVVEEIARDDFAFAFALVNTHNSAARLARDGNDSQRARYLDGLLRGELIGVPGLQRAAPRVHRVRKYPRHGARGMQVEPPADAGARESGPEEQGGRVDRPTRGFSASVTSAPSMAPMMAPATP